MPTAFGRTTLRATTEPQRAVSAKGREDAYRQRHGTLAWVTATAGFERGQKQYELSNHLGNVLVTVSDKKEGVDADGNGVVEYFTADVTTAQDYYPFGMLMPTRKGHSVAGGWAASGGNENGLPSSLELNGRSGNQPAEYRATESIEFTTGFASGEGDSFETFLTEDAGTGGTGSSGSGDVAGGYRYGFGSQEHSSEVHDNAYTAEFWQYDARTARRWNVDPVHKVSESPYGVFSNNPIFYLDPSGAAPTPPLYHQIKKGETLKGIAKQYDISIKTLMAINDNIKNPDKIKAGDVLTVGTARSQVDLYMEYGSPEIDFQNSPLTKYNNPANGKFSNSATATMGELALSFYSNDGRSPDLQNILVVGGPLLSEIARLPSVRDLIKKGAEELNQDKKLQAGEYYTSTYTIGSLTGPNGRRIITESFKDLTKGKIRDNTFFSAENWLGSYGFSMRVTGEGTAVICIYDSKTVESASDRNSVLQKITPNLAPTYQRYSWEVKIEKIKKPGSVYETYGY